MWVGGGHINPTMCVRGGHINDTNEIHYLGLAHCPRLQSRSVQNVDAVSGRGTHALGHRIANDLVPVKRSTQHSLWQSSFRIRGLF